VILLDDLELVELVGAGSRLAGVLGLASRLERLGAVESGGSPDLDRLLRPQAGSHCLCSLLCPVRRRTPLKHGMEHTQAQVRNCPSTPHNPIVPSQVLEVEPTERKHARTRHVPRTRRILRLQLQLFPVPITPELFTALDETVNLSKNSRGLLWLYVLSCSTFGS
jgi:hypothetical protein